MTALVLAILGVTASAHAAAKTTYSIDYIVTISEKHPEIAQVRWELSGIEEVQWLRLRFPANRLSQLGGSGTLEPMPDGARSARRCRRRPR